MPIAALHATRQCEWHPLAGVAFQLALKCGHGDGIWDVDEPNLTQK
jgi:hypothetical protein